MITLAHFLTLGAILFCIAIAGIFINRKNVIVLLMAIELMLLAVNTNFVAFSRYLGDPSGQVFVFFILTVAAAAPLQIAGVTALGLPLSYYGEIAAEYAQRRDAMMTILAQAGFEAAVPAGAPTAHQLFAS